MKTKHRIAALFTCCLLLSGSGLSAAVYAEENDNPESGYSYGDVNLDQTVDISDAVLLARYAAEDAEAVITQTGKKYADVNQDGNLTTDDTLLILKYIAKIIPSLEPAGEIETNYQSVNLMKDIQAGEVKGKAVDQVFTDAQYAFSASLLREADQNNAERKNLLISPLSVSVALSMTANGAKEQTLTEMEKVLGGDLKIADINAYYADYLNALPNSEFAALYPANSIWIKNDRGLCIVPEQFLQTNADYYGADAFMAPFTDDTVNDINSWVKENTHEMIPKLLNNIPNENVFMYLINALAFEADWASAYKNTGIWKDEFKPYQGDAFETDMMFSEESSYLEDDYATGFIKYYKGYGYSFAAILPKESESVTVADYIGMMTPESLQSLISKKQKCTVKTMMPKFSFSYDTELSSALKAIGMPTAFDEDTAEFSGLNEKGGGYISRVLHKTFIQVDEAGTKAGAVTAVELQVKGAIEREEPKTVYLDRPFIFMILDNQHNVPVFIGYVMNPAEE